MGLLPPDPTRPPSIPPSVPPSLRPYLYASLSPIPHPSFPVSLALFLSLSPARRSIFKDEVSYIIGPNVVKLARVRHTHTQTGDIVINYILLVAREREAHSLLTPPLSLPFSLSPPPPSLSHANTKV